jgi:sodium transport system permease protein
MSSVAIRADRRLSWLAVVAIGCTAFTFVRFRTMLPPPHYGAIGVITTVVLAVVQEFVFRRFLYAQLERFGPAVAVFVTAALFALFHVPRYGWGVLPIDFAAGLIFSWQRYATGSWTAPAATHVVANLVSLW